MTVHTFVVDSVVVVDLVVDLVVVVVAVQVETDGLVYSVVGDVDIVVAVALDSVVVGPVAVVVDLFVDSLVVVRCFGAITRCFGSDY